MTKYINWFIFLAYNYYQLGKFISAQLPYLGIKYSFIGSLLFYHNFISFCLVVIGFLSFVISLKQGFLKYQFRLFGWIIIATLICSTASWYMCFNVYEGLIYFLLPAMLIIINDIFAYLFGYFLGKHQLIALSPKKTWEGYIGGAVSTCLFSIMVTFILFSLHKLFKVWEDCYVLVHRLMQLPFISPLVNLLFLKAFTLDLLLYLSFKFM